MNLQHFNTCKKIAESSNHEQHKLGAVIVNKNRIISKACNQIKTHPSSPHPYNMLHAEILSLIRVGQQNIEGSTIYVYRETKNGDLANSRPCIHCLTMLRLYGVEKIYYTTEKGYVYEEI